MSNAIFMGLNNWLSMHYCIDMKNILVHHNNGQPVYIALSESMTFDVVYLGVPRSSHNSIGVAIKSATNEFISASYAGDSDWILMGD
jgi:methylmalonyl-CoA mutase cobalamin-binding subunit